MVKGKNADILEMANHRANIVLWNIHCVQWSFYVKTTHETMIVAFSVILKSFGALTIFHNAAASTFMTFFNQTFIAVLCGILHKRTSWNFVILNLKKIEKNIEI